MSQRILLVEDNSLIRDSMKYILENSLICEVFESENGEVALEMIQGELNPNIIVSDVEMPKMTGLELLSSIKPLNIPVIIMSGKNHFKNQAISNGAMAFLQKPLDFDVLLAMIEKYARP